MDEMLRLPVGIDNFEKLRNNGFYYVDKTRFIEQLLSNLGDVNLFTRPRRFGKTLNMSMFKHFFEVGSDLKLFDGLYISGNKKICDKYLGKYPVIFLTLKGVEALDFKTAKRKLIDLIVTEAERFQFLIDSNVLLDIDKDKYRRILTLNDKDDDITLSSSLRVLSMLLKKHYGKNAIILIDEYDVPLDKAFQNGYYKEMVSIIRNLFSDALKTNEFLEFAVLTGCLRVSKESIFAGLNNLKAFNITDTRLDEMFGFTDKEVKSMLEYYNIQDRFEETKAWYDGYRFGDAYVYCPWDVINHVDRIKDDINARPEAYWINTSGNGLVKRFIDKADKSTRDEIEKLIVGESITKDVRLDLTYDEIDNSIDNLWSVLFTTGYLTYTGVNEDGSYNLIIPNKEVREVYKLQIQEWFKKTISGNKNILDPFWEALLNGDSKMIEDILYDILNRTISVFDPKGDEKEKEKYYHALLTGILIGNGTWSVASNKESGDGFPDIMVEPTDKDTGLIFEIKAVDKFTELDSACDKAMAQIHEKRYKQYLEDEGRFNIWAYGIAFFKKRCKVVVEKL